MNMIQEQIGIPSCFSSGEKHSEDPTAIIRSGQSVYVSVYRTILADKCRLITVTWCKNLLLHGLTVCVEGPEGETQYACKVDLKPWSFWKKQGSKRFLVDGEPVDVYWDLKVAKFNGEIEPESDYYVAVVCNSEVVLLLGNLRKEAYRKTGCRPSLIDPILVTRKEHVFGRRKFLSRVKFHEKGSFHEISIECRNGSGNHRSNEIDPEMEIRIDGLLVIHVKHLQWKFRGNESIHLNKTRMEVYWDVHDWLFLPGLRHGMFIFNPTLLSSSPQGINSCGTKELCLFLYAWKVE